MISNDTHTKMDIIICLIGLLVIGSSVSQECGEAHKTATSEFRYLTFPLNSSAVALRDVDCRVTITATNGSYIKLIVTYAEMRSSCNFEVLRIYEGTSVRGSVIGNVCESGRKRFTIVSTGHAVTVRYKTGLSNATRVFMLTYKSEYLGDKYVCGNSNMIPSFSSQEITSPFYPNNYPNNTLCSWSIKTADSGSDIVIKITYLDTEYSLNCAADYLQIFDYDVSLGKWCGTSPPAELISGHHTMITFRSDGGISMTGFKLQYTLTKRQSFSSQSTFGYWAWLGTAFAIVTLTCVGCCCVCGMARKRRRRGPRHLNQSIPARPNPPASQQLVYTTDRDQPAQNAPPSTFPPPPSYDEVITKDRSEPLPPPYSSLNDVPNLQ